MKRSRPRTLPSSPARAASASRTAAPSSTRAHARNAGGMPSSTATLMNRYGMPQRVDTAAKAAHARALMGAIQHELPARDPTPVPFGEDPRRPAADRRSGGHHHLVRVADAVARLAEAQGLVGDQAAAGDRDHGEG